MDTDDSSEYNESETWSAEEYQAMDADPTVSRSDELDSCTVQEEVTDAYEFLESRNVSATLNEATTTSVDLTFPVDSGLRGVLRCGPTFTFVARLVSLVAPPHIGIRDERLGVLWTGLDCDRSSLRFVKPLLTCVRNDLEILWLKDSDPARAQRVVWERISLLGENYEGVFEAGDDMYKAQTVRNIVYHEVICSSRNVVKRVVEVVAHNMKNFSRRCYLCGSRHLEANRDGLPWACSNDLCRFRVCDETNGVLFSHLRQRPEAIELCIILALNAASDHRAENVFIPKPLGLSPAEITEVLQKLPPVFDMKECNSEFEVRRFLNEQDGRCYGICCWLVMNIPYYIQSSSMEEMLQESWSPTSQKLQIPEETDNKYLGSLIGKPGKVFRVSGCFTAMARQFQANLESFGSSFLFHGSPLQNWYSILKHSPRNMSRHRDFKLHGAMYGEGIYMTDSFHLATYYSCKRSTTIPWKNSEYFDDIDLVAVCEVADKAASKDIREHGKYYLCIAKEAEIVNVKFLIVVARIFG
ncbi:hypothetical protein BSKO_08450 [Bryopsis sp. KO-2023]|nr:hypothetical protein BSKO_08450 [Bryopsis sp. KO-2023]